jgi:hypothetical protein
MSDKKPNGLVEYFMERTEKDFEKVNVRLDKHDKRLWVMIALIVLLSPVGLEVGKRVPQLFEVAAALAGGK